jgi:AAA+ ATPase superfamily predicted ATPase
MQTVEEGDKKVYSIVKKQDDSFINLLKEAKASLTDEAQALTGAYVC